MNPNTKWKMKFTEKLPYFKILIMKYSAFTKENNENDESVYFKAWKWKCTVF